MGLLWNRNRHRVISGTIPSTYTPAATSIAWQSVQNNPAALGITGNAIAVVKDQRGAVMAGLIPVYNSGTPAKATINSSGVYTTVANGSTVITASYLALTAINTTITVQQVTASITLSPASPTVASGTAQVFTAAGKDSNNVTCTLGAGTWLSSDPTDFPVTSGGSVTPSVTSGSAVIKFTETSSGVYGTTTITASASSALMVGIGGTQITSLTGYIGDTNQLQYKYGGNWSSGADVTSNVGLALSSSDITKVTIDNPTLTSITGVVTEGDVNVSHSIVGTNLITGQGIGGLGTGVTAGTITASSPTAATVLISASGSTPGTESIYITDTNHGNSGTQSISVVAASNVIPTGAVRRYKAAFGTNTTVNGAAITSFTDMVAGKVAAPIGTPSATYLTSGSNGKPGIQFADSPGALAEAAFDAAINTNEATYVIIYKHSGTSESNYRSLFELQNSTNVGVKIEYASSMSIEGRVGTGSAQANVGAFTVDAGNVYHTLIITVSQSLSQAALYIDNVLSGTVASTAFTPNTVNPLALFGGYNSGSGGNTVQGVLHEFIEYARVFTSGDRTIQAAYSSAEYAI